MNEKDIEVDIAKFNAAKESGSNPQEAIASVNEEKNPEVEADILKYNAARSAGADMKEAIAIINTKADKINKDLVGR